MMVETDLRGVDSHGISMLPTYDKEFRAGRLNMRPQCKTVRDGPSMALGSTPTPRSGHPVSVHAMNLAVDKCLAIGRGGGRRCSTRTTSARRAATRRSRPTAA